MEPHMISTIEHHKVNLIKALQPAELFLSHLECSGIISSEERELVEKSHNLTKDQLLRLVELIQQKDNGWPAIIHYLRSNDNNLWADKLEATACDRSQSQSGKQRKSWFSFLYRSAGRSTLKEFSIRLAHYYQLAYAHLPTIGDSPKHVKDIWVPLKIDGRSEGHLPADRIDHVELLNRLKSAKGRNIALIKGDPGMGKTTLAKKIAYDWALNCSSSKQKLFTPSFSFTLVLAVPLRHAGKSYLFDQLAIDYFFSVGGGQLVKDLDKEELKNEINKLGSKLLVILDGLDEYANYKESPFKVVFAPPFLLPLAYTKEPPPMITFKLIVTSRPYACERVNEDFWPLKFVILPLDANHLSDFVNLYCQTPEGNAKVTEYLKVNAKLVIQVPLILTLICYLADSVQEIPTNMTNLYDSLIRQMIRRESRQEKLTEFVDIQKWKDSNLMKTTGELAFREISERGGLGNFEFTSDSLERSYVTNDSFICGFLLHKFDFAKDLLKAEFPHRSIQEFFAALHCYQLMLAGCTDELGDIRRLILRFDSQFGRFLFGICSLKETFDQMTKWLSPSLGDTVKIWSLANEISQFGTNLLDCTPVANTLMGQRLHQSIGHLEERITSQMDMPSSLQTVDRTLRLTDLPAEFIEALHLVDLTRNPSGDTADWCISDNRQSAQMAVVSFRLPELLEEKFDQIDNFIWTPYILQESGMGWKTVFSRIKSLPPVRSFVMSTAHKSYPPAGTSVFVHIGYGRTTGSELTNFRFWYKDEERKELIEAIPDEKLVKLTENKRRKKMLSTHQSVMDIRVTVDSCESQSALIYSLIRLCLLSPAGSADRKDVATSLKPCLQEETFGQLWSQLFI